MIKLLPGLFTVGKIIEGCFRIVFVVGGVNRSVLSDKAEICLSEINAGKIHPYSQILAVSDGRRSVKRNTDAAVVYSSDAVERGLIAVFEYGKSGGISEALSVCERKNGGRFGIAIEGNRIKALNAGCVILMSTLTTSPDVYSDLSVTTLRLILFSSA